MTVTTTVCDTGERKLQLQCTKCNRVLSSSCSPAHTSRGQTYITSDLHQMYFSLVSGIGYAGLKMSQAMVTGGEMSCGKYNRHCSYLYREMVTLYNEKIEASRAIVFNYYTAPCGGDTWEAWISASCEASLLHLLGRTLLSKAFCWWYHLLLVIVKTMTALVIQREKFGGQSALYLSQQSSVRH